MSRLVACLLVAACAGPVTACINDSELPSHEREFRSQYGKPTPPPQSPEPVPVASAPVPMTGLLAGGVGVVLLAGATVLTWRGAVGRG